MSVATCWARGEGIGRSPVRRISAAVATHGATTSRATPRAVATSADVSSAVARGEAEPQVRGRLDGRACAVGRLVQVAAGQQRQSEEGPRQRQLTLDTQLGALRVGRATDVDSGVDVAVGEVEPARGRQQHDPGDPALVGVERHRALDPATYPVEVAHLPRHHGGGRQAGRQLFR